jgi:hypothetical protein
MMIDITIATMGRLTKKRDIAYLASPAAAAAGATADDSIGLVRTVSPSRSACRPSATT